MFLGKLHDVVNLFAILMAAKHALHSEIVCNLTRREESGSFTAPSCKEVE